MTNTFELAILLFGKHRDIAGRAVMVLDLPAGATVGDVRAALSQHPELGSSVNGAAVAVNRRYERDEAPVSAGDEVALIPPVAGG